MQPGLKASRRVVTFTTFRLTDVVRETLAAFDCPEKIILDTEILEDSELEKHLMVRADAALVADAIRALLTGSVNALAMTGTGTIRVRTGKTHCTRKDLDSDDVFFGTGRAEGNYAYVEIFDSGTGLSKEARREIFAKTDASPDPSRRPSLLPTRWLAETHEGAIEIRSPTLRGVSVRLLFSLAHTESGRRRKIDP